MATLRFSNQRDYADDCGATIWRVCLTFRADRANDAATSEHVGVQRSLDHTSRPSFKQLDGRLAEREQPVEI
jgi:hypothetical protein